MRGENTEAQLASLLQQYIDREPSSKELARIKFSHTGILTTLQGDFKLENKIEYMRAVMTRLNTLDQGAMPRQTKASLKASREILKYSKTAGAEKGTTLLTFMRSMIQSLSRALSTGSTKGGARPVALRSDPQAPKPSSGAPKPE